MGGQRAATGHYAAPHQAGTRSPLRERRRGGEGVGIYFNLVLDLNGGREVVDVVGTILVWRGERRRRRVILPLGYWRKEVDGLLANLVGRRRRRRKESGCVVGLLGYCLLMIEVSVIVEDTHGKEEEIVLVVVLGEDKEKRKMGCCGYLLL